MEDEFEIVIEDDNLLDSLLEETLLELPGEDDHYRNLAEELDEEVLTKIGNEVFEGFELDRQSRTDWESLTTQGLSKLGLKRDDGDMLFDGACDVNHPIILESVVSYQSRAAKELLPPAGPVKTQILGRKTPEAEQRAFRVKKFMNYQLMELMPEYWSNTEDMLFYLPLCGNGFKKKHYDNVKDRTVDTHIFPTDIYVNTSCSSLDEADRVSHVMRLTEKQMRRALANGQFLDVLLDSPTPPEISELERELRTAIGQSCSYDDCYELIEQQCYLPLGVDGVYDAESYSDLPYIVTIHRSSQKVLSIRRGWTSYDETYQKFDYITHYKFVPSGSFYGFGFIHLLGNLQKTLTVTVRSLMDAGQFANLRGGFKMKNARVVGGNDEPIAPGEIRDISYSGEDLSKAFHFLNYAEPSPVLKDIYSNLAAETRAFADSTQQVVSESTNYGPVGTTMALLEASAKFFNAIHARAYRGQHSELKILASYNYEYLPDEDERNIVEDVLDVRRDDYDPTMVAVIPVADPNSPSQAQRISKAQTILSQALQQPEKHNIEEVYKDFYNALDVENSERYMKLPKQPKAQGPLADVLNVVNGEAIQAFEGQDHQAHIAFKSAWLQDPTQGQSPLMKPFEPLIVANIREHQMLDYAAKLGRLQAEQQMSEEQAAQQLAQLAEQAKMAQQQGSPEMLLAQAEMLDAKTNARRETRAAAESQTKLGLEAIKTGVQLEKEKTKAEQADRDFDLRQTKLGLDMVKDGMDTVDQFNELVSSE